MRRFQARSFTAIALLAVVLGLAPAGTAVADKAVAKGADAKRAGAGKKAATPSPDTAGNAGPATPVPAPVPAPEPAAEADAAATTATNGSASKGIQSLGAGEQRLWLVDHGDTWSLHVESVRTDTLFQLWRTAGGPRVASKVSLDRPWTTAVHRVKAERIIERMLDGFSYTLHYDGRGRLDAVHVYSLDSQTMYKTPRLTESRVKWSETETADLAESAAAASPSTTLPDDPEPR